MGDINGRETVRKQPRERSEELFEDELISHLLYQSNEIYLQELAEDWEERP